MNNEETVLLAREATRRDDWWDDDQALERFAALVTAAEREKVVAWMIQRGYSTGHGDTVEDLLKELDWQIRESERESCAKVCERDDSMRWSGAANAIRDRGKHE